MRRGTEETEPRRSGGGSTCAPVGIDARDVRGFPGDGSLGDRVLRVCSLRPSWGRISVWRSVRGIAPPERCVQRQSCACAVTGIAWESFLLSSGGGRCVSRGGPISVPGRASAVHEGKTEEEAVPIQQRTASRRRLLCATNVCADFGCSQGHRQKASTQMPRAGRTRPTCLVDPIPCASALLGFGPDSRYERRVGSVHVGEGGCPEAIGEGRVLDAGALVLVEGRHCIGARGVFEPGKSGQGALEGGARAI